MVLQNIFQNNFEIIISEFFLTIIILTLLLFCTFFFKTYNNQKILIIKILNYLLVYCLFLDFLLIENTPKNFISLFNGILIFNEFSFFVKKIIIISTIIILIVQINYILNQYLINFENNILIILSILGLMLLSMANHFITLYLAIELQSLCFYILTASQKKSYFSLESSLKYFILGSIASSFILMGISIIYGSVGTLNFNQIFLILSNINENYFMNVIITLVSGFFFILIGLFFKIGIAPFHIWLPDVYEGSPNNITFFFSIVPKIVILSLIIKLLFDTFSNIFNFFEIILYLCSFLSLTLGTFFSIQQKTFKRLLAYSSINHAGFLLLGISLNTFNGLIYSLFYIIIYIIMNINFWTIYLSIFLNKKPIKYLTDFSNLYNNNFLLSIIIVINLFSMAGIPPLAGFFSKFFILKSAFEVSLNFLVLIAVFVSAVSSFYYIRFIKIIFFDKKKNTYIMDSINKINSIIIIINTYFIIIYCLFPDYLNFFLKKIILINFN